VSTFARSDFKARRDALFFPGTSLPHAKYVTFFASGCIPDNDKTLLQVSIADHSDFTVVLAGVLNFKGGSGKDNCSVLEVQPAIRKRLVTFVWIVGYLHKVIVTTITPRVKDCNLWRKTAPNASLTARAPWKGAGGGSLFSGLARPYQPDYYQGTERSSGLLGVRSTIQALQCNVLLSRLFHSQEYEFCIDQVGRRYRIHIL